MDLDKLNKELEILEKVDVSIIEGEHGYMVDGILGGFKSAVDKMKYAFYKQVLLGMLAAMIIIITYVACLTVTQSIEEAGIKQLVIGWVFPAALVVITLLGGGFLTTHVVAAIPVTKKIVRLDTYFKNVGGIFLGNMIGAFVVVSLVYLAGMMDEGSGLGKELHNISLKKMTYLYDSTNHDLYSLKTLTAGNVAKTILAVFASGILCNFIVSATLPISNSSKQKMVTLFGLFLAIMVFAVAGFQHCVANLIFVWVLFYEWVGGHYDTQAHYFLIFLAINILPAILGNAVGGIVFMSGILYLINKKYCDALFASLRKEVILEQIQKNKSKEELKKQIQK